MDIVLAAATIIGGLAALWFFWEKLWPTKQEKAKASAPSDGSSTSQRRRQAAAELAKLRDWAVTNLQNRTIRSDDDQDQLETDAHEWEEKAARLMEGHADPSEISDFKTLGTYTPKGLPPLVSNVVHQSVYTNMLKGRNAKLRNEMSEQLDRLMKIVRKLEQKAD